MSDFLRESQLAEIRHRERVRRAVIRLKRSAHAPVALTDMEELKGAARHLIRLLEKS